jgi:hypothetical protein
VTWIHLSLMLGVLVGQLAYNVDRPSAIRSFGVFSFFIGNFGLLLAYFLSPRILERPREDSLAMQPISRPPIVPSESLDPVETKSQKILRISILILLKVFFCLTFNIALNSTSLFGTETSFWKGEQIPIAQHSFACFSQLYRYRNGTIYIFFRILGILLSLATVDYKRRINFLALIPTSVLLILLALFDIITYRYTKIIQSTFQFFAGFSVGSEVLAVEKFKARGIVFNLGLDVLLQVLFFLVFVVDVVVTEKAVAVFRGVSGVCLLVIGIAINVMAGKLERDARDKRM